MQSGWEIYWIFYVNEICVFKNDLRQYRIMGKVKKSDMIISSWIFIITTGFMHLLTTKHQLKFGGKHMDMDPGCCKSRAITEGVDDNMHHNLDVKPIPEKVLYRFELLHEVFEVCLK